MPVKKKKKTVKATRVPKTRNGNTLTESQYWSKVRSVLRNGFRYWKPMTNALEAASRPYKGDNKRLKKEYQCARCEDWFPRKNVAIDHIIPVGSLKCGEDLKGFLERLTPEETEAFQILCDPCHLIKTNLERPKKQ